MAIKFHHLHLKARDPDKTAAWYDEAFGFKVKDRIVRPSGDTFITCATTDGTIVVISGEKSGETLPAGHSGTQFGLEHFAVATDDFDESFARMKSLGAPVIDGPMTTPTGIRIAFIEAPDNVRIELMYFPK
jgi:lactoylglutathione lyase